MVFGSNFFADAHRFIVDVVVLAGLALGGFRMIRSEFEETLGKSSRKRKRR